jgi:hypothetical protein
MQYLAARPPRRFFRLLGRKYAVFSAQPLFPLLCESASASNATVGYGALAALGVLKRSHPLGDQQNGSKMPATPQRDMGPDSPRRFKTLHLLGISKMAATPAVKYCALAALGF